MFDPRYLLFSCFIDTATFKHSNDICLLFILFFRYYYNYLQYPFGWGCRIYWLHFSKVVRTPHHYECPGYDTKPHLMVRFWSWSFRECGVLFQCHYSQVRSDSGVVGPVRIPSVGQIELFNHLLRIIMSYLKSYTLMQIIYIIYECMIELFMLNSNTCNHLTECKQMIDIIQNY